MPEYEICNQIFDKCPGCGQYKGQYHDAEYPCLEEELNDHGCPDSEQDKVVKGTD